MARCTSASRRRASSSSPSASISSAASSRCARASGMAPLSAPATARTPSDPGDERLVAQRRRRVGRASRPIAHRVELRPVHAADRELDHQRDSLRRAGIVELGKRALEPGNRLLLPAEEVLDAGARDDEPDAQRVRLRRHDAHALEQHRVAVREPARGGERSRTGEQELDLLLCGRGLRQQAQRAGEPAGGARGRPQRGGLARFAQHGDRVGVALTGRGFDVVRARRRGRAACLRALRRFARERRAASLRARPRRRRGARADGGSGTAWGRRWGG